MKSVLIRPKSQPDVAKMKFNQDKYIEKCTSKKQENDVATAEYIKMFGSHGLVKMI